MSVYHFGFILCNFELMPLCNGVANDAGCNSPACKLHLFDQHSSTTFDSGVRRSDCVVCHSNNTDVVYVGRTAFRHVCYTS